MSITPAPSIRPKCFGDSSWYEPRCVLLGGQAQLRIMRMARYVLDDGLGSLLSDIWRWASARPAATALGGDVASRLVHRLASGRARTSMLKRRLCSRRRRSARQPEGSLGPNSG